MRNLIRLSPVALVAAVACAGAPGSDGANADDLVPTTVTAAPQAHLWHRMPRGGASTLSVRTLPNSACSLRAASEAAGAHESMPIYADDDGIARVHLQDVVGTAQTLQLALDCQDDAGRTLTHRVEVTAADGVRGEAPAPYNTAGKARLPALDVDPASLTPEQVTARGYPPRPDPSHAQQYQTWLSLVSKRPTVIAPHRVADPAHVHGPARVANASGNSTNWSGYVIATNGSAPQYGEIFGAWPVPRAYAQSGFWHLNYSSFWVGMDGWGSPDVVQAGTDQNTQTIFWIQASSYGAWTEWYPLSSQSISNFSVNPGDVVYCWVWVTDQNGTWTGGNKGWFYLWNTTQNTATGYLTTTAPSGTVFNGHQAEWVMERPTVGGSVANLANYSWAQLNNAWAYTFSGVAKYYTSDYSVNLTMVNGSDVLSTVSPVNSGTMQFTWHNYN